MSRLWKLLCPVFLFSSLNWWVSVSAEVLSFNSLPHSLRVEAERVTEPFTLNAATCIAATVFSSPSAGGLMDIIIAFENIVFRGLKSCIYITINQTLEAKYQSSTVVLTSVKLISSPTEIRCCLFTPLAPWFDATVMLFLQNTSVEGPSLVAQATIPPLTLPLVLRTTQQLQIATISGQSPKSLSSLALRMLLSQYARALSTEWDWQELRSRMRLLQAVSVADELLLTVVFVPPTPSIHDLTHAATRAQTLLREVGINTQLYMPSSMLLPQACDSMCGGMCGVCQAQEPCVCDDDCLSGRCWGHVCVEENADRTPARWPVASWVWLVAAMAGASVLGSGL